MLSEMGQILRKNHGIAATFVRRVSLIVLSYQSTTVLQFEMVMKQGCQNEFWKDFSIRLKIYFLPGR